MCFIFGDFFLFCLRLFSFQYISRVVVKTTLHTCCVGGSICCVIETFWFYLFAVWLVGVLLCYIFIFALLFFLHLWFIRDQDGWLVSKFQMFGLLKLFKYFIYGVWSFIYIFTNMECVKRVWLTNFCLFF